MPDILPLADAVAKLDAKTPVGSLLRSAEWEQVPVQLRERAQFSAGVESARLLQTIQDRLRAEVNQQRELLANGKLATLDRSSFINAVRTVAREEGLEPARVEDVGTVRDVTSIPRLGLIYDMQKASAAGFARHKLDTSEGALLIYPAYRLGPSTAEEPRPQIWWQRRWSEAGREVGWAGAVQGEFVALKTSPIWAALSRFGTPWPPFDWGSTRELEEVDRAEAVALGLLAEKQVLAGTQDGFNDTLEASAANLSPAVRMQLTKWFGNAVEFVGEKLKWLAGG